MKPLRKDQLPSKRKQKNLTWTLSLTWDTKRNKGSMTMTIIIARVVPEGISRWNQIPAPCLSQSHALSFSESMQGRSTSFEGVRAGSCISQSTGGRVLSDNTPVSPPRCQAIFCVKQREVWYPSDSLWWRLTLANSQQEISTTQLSWSWSPDSPGHRWVLEEEVSL